MLYKCPAVTRTFEVTATLTIPRPSWLLQLPTMGCPFIHSAVTKTVPPASWKAFALRSMCVAFSMLGSAFTDISNPLKACEFTTFTTALPPGNAGPIVGGNDGHVGPDISAMQTSPVDWAWTRMVDVGKRNVRIVRMEKSATGERALFNMVLAVSPSSH